MIVKEQAAKEAEAEATRKAIEANFKNNCPEDMLGAQELEAAVAAINANKKKVIYLTRWIRIEHCLLLLL